MTPNINDIDDYLCKKYASMLRKLDDDKYHHVEYIKTDGTLVVEPVPSPEKGGAQSLQERSDIKVYCGIYCIGNGYVGIDPAENIKYIENKIEELQKLWQEAQKVQGIYINPYNGVDIRLHIRDSIYIESFLFFDFWY